MLFNSFAFLIFIPIFFLSYFLTHGNVRLFVCLIYSYIFYSWWDWRFLSLIILVTAVNYIAGFKISNCQRKKIKKYIFIITVFFDLGLLGIFKYFEFFSETFSTMLLKLGMNPSVSTINIILPVGISFYIFQTLSYVFDIYRNKLDYEPSILKFATFVALFPQLVAGPIVRANIFLPQLNTEHPFSIKKISEGIRIVLYGYFIKIVIADSIAPIVDRMLSVPENETSLVLLTGSFLFSFQIYCDFHGYSLIAIGLGKMMGFDFGTNFNKPYLSKNFSEFWNRWHISLSSWLRDYLYFPLGGNRTNLSKTCRNLFITMFLGGLWHGANWTFVLWGLIHGIYLIIQHTFQKVILFFNYKKNNCPKWIINTISVIFVFSLTTFAWIFFRSPDLSHAIKIITKIISFDNFNIFYMPEKFLVVKCVLLISILMAIEFLNLIKTDLLNNRFVKIVSIPLILWGISLLGTFAGNSFIYFQF